MSGSGELRTCGERVHLSYQSVLSRLHVSDILNNFTGTKIGLDDIVFQSCNLDEQYKHEKISSQDLASVPAPSLMLSTSCFFALIARLSSAGLISNVPVLDVSVNRQDVIVSAEQPASIANVSIQRG